MTIERKLNTSNEVDKELFNDFKELSDSIYRYEVFLIDSLSSFTISRIDLY